MTGIGSTIRQQSGAEPTVCALCKLPRELRNSHVISEFLYEAMYDDKHRFHAMAVGEYARFEQKGFREPLLCQDCETNLSVWEGYAKSLLTGKIPLKSQQGNGVTWVSGIDYTQFKLFQLSILWRAGVAAQPFFSRVRLGPHEDHIRMMLLRGDPGAADRYGCLMWEIRLQGAVATAIIQPTITRIVSAKGYRFTFGGYFWAYPVASHRLPEILRSALLQPSGRMLIGRGDLAKAPFFTQLVARLGNTVPTRKRL